MEKPKENIVIADCEKEELKTLIDGLEETTNIQFKIENKICNGKSTFFSNIRRYFIYIFYPLKFVVNRKKYNYIICWQQFFGLFFSFFCRLFRVKKQNKLIVCSFVYKEKNGILKNIYRNIMKYCIQNKYIDYLHVLSKNHAEIISRDFNIPMEKFVVIPFGLDDTYEKYKNLKINYKNFSLAIGRSNRDYDFLINEWKKIPKENKLIIICDTYKAKEKLPENIILLNNIVGEEQYPFFINCKTVIIPIDKGSTCSGETVLLTAMSYYKPIIITKPSTLAEMYIKHGVNGFCLEKNKDMFSKNVINILQDKKLLKEIGKNARKDFEENYSRYNMGKKLGETLC